MKVEVSVPDEVVSVWRMSSEDAGARAQLEFALHLYASRQISHGRAAEVSGLSRAKFDKALNQAGIVRNYADSDLESDLAWANA